MRENTAEIARLANYRVLKAGSGKRGVEQARRNSPTSCSATS